MVLIARCTLFEACRKGLHCSCQRFIYFHVNSLLDAQCLPMLAHCCPISGVFAGAHDLKTEWVLIKGIKDYYADGSQPSSDSWRCFASVMAASVVANILSDPVVFEEWSHYSQGNNSCSFRPLYLTYADRLNHFHS